MMHQDTELPNHISRRQGLYKNLCYLLPNPGNVIFTVLMIAITLWAQSAGAITLGAATATNPVTTIPYQGYLTDEDSNPLNGPHAMTFKLYPQANGSTALWAEQWNGDNRVQIEDGLFSVQLGALNTIRQDVIANNEQLYVGIAIGAEAEMIPRVQLGSVPYAVIAQTVPDGSITDKKLGQGAVKSNNLALSYGSACQPGNTSLTFPGGGYASLEISDLTLDFLLDRPSKVLIGINGLAKFNGGGDTNLGIRFDGSTKYSLTSYYGRGDNEWYQVGAHKIFDFSSGSHILQTYGHSNASGTMTIHGTLSHQVCIYYLVLGE